MTAPSALTPEFVSQALRLPPGAQREPFSAVVTDSRKIQKGCLFVALKGEKFDGHDFIEAAVSQGATGILCRKNYPAIASDALFFNVEDTLVAYRKLAAAWRREFQIPRIAVAGSVGKPRRKRSWQPCSRENGSTSLKPKAAKTALLGFR